MECRQAMGMGWPGWGREEEAGFDGARETFVGGGAACVGVPAGFVGGDTSLLMAALALMVRADPLSARLQTVVGHR